MTSRHDSLDAAIAAVDAADDSLPFSDLIEIAARGRTFDKARHLRFGDWSDVDFAGSNLDGFDFTGAHLIGCNFAGVSIQGAHFDGAIIDIARPYAKLDPKRTNLRRAKDWDAYVRSWLRAEDLPDDSHLPVGAIFQDAPFAPELVAVPPGRFTIGSSPEEMAALEKEHGSDYGKWVKFEGPEREVTIGHRLAIGRFAVTFEEWDAAQTHADWQRLSGQAKRRPDEHKFGRDRRPLIDVSWNDAQAYARWLTGVTGQSYRLLTEAEWEYCCRAGTTTRYAVGDTITQEQAQFRAEGTAEVGSFACNAWGLYDMHGNVLEWCEDAWVENYDDLPEDGSARDKEQQHVSRVVRGGSWFYNPQNLRSADRLRHRPISCDGIIGFRLARTLSA